MKTHQRIGRWLLVLAFALPGIGLGAGIETGQTIRGTVVSEKSRQTWTTEIRILAVTPSGEVRGEIAWPSLNAVHVIRGAAVGSTFTFTETAYLKQGAAHLGCEYALVIDRDALKGRWIEPGKDWGTLELMSVATERPSAAGFAPGMRFSGTVYGERGSQTFPTTIEIGEVNPATGAFRGTMTWRTLDAVHRIEGKITGNAITFREADYIKKGRAHLNCEYELALKGAALTGQWREPGFDKGTIALNQE